MSPPLNITVTFDIWSCLGNVPTENMRLIICSRTGAIVSITYFIGRICKSWTSVHLLFLSDKTDVTISCAVVGHKNALFCIGAVKLASGRRHSVNVGLICAYVVKSWRGPRSGRSRSGRTWGGMRKVADDVRGRRFSTWFAIYWQLDVVAHIFTFMCIIWKYAVFLKGYRKRNNVSKVVQREP